MNNFAAFDGAPVRTRLLVVKMQDEGGRIGRMPDGSEPYRII